MSVVTITQIVHIQNFGLRMLEQELDVSHDVWLARRFDHFTWITELHHDAVLPDKCSLALLQLANFLHFIIAVLGIRPLARAARSIRYYDSAKPLVGGVETLRDAVISSNFEVILVGNNAKMGDSTKCRPWIG